MLNIFQYIVKEDKNILYYDFLFTILSNYIRQVPYPFERFFMLIDHAPSISGVRGSLRHTRRKFILRLVFFILLMALLSFSCFNFKLFRDSNTIKPQHKEETINQNITQTAIRQPLLPKIIKKSISVSTGDTLMELLVAEGIDRGEASNVIKALTDIFNPRQLRQGQEITLTFKVTDNSDTPLFFSMSLIPDLTREIQVLRSSKYEFSSKEIKNQLIKMQVKAQAEIKTNLYNAAIDAGIPIEILIQMIRAYSYDVDFQRDIQPGDIFNTLYEKIVDKNGNYIKGGELLFASLNTSGRPITIYRYKTDDGEIDIYDAKGQSIRKTLMVTPIDGARLSSGYGMRRHPILGYSRMHRGLDFAASSGTPIMAAGDGVIELAGRKGGYGNYIRIRHANSYQTAYGHMKKFASGIKKGVRVKQGETIGYVGSTGISTGPHLHYEVLHMKKNVNPVSIKTPSGKILKGKELENFNYVKNELKAQYNSINSKEKLVSR